MELNIILTIINFLILIAMTVITIFDKKRNFKQFPTGNLSRYDNHLKYPGEYYDRKFEELNDKIGSVGSRLNSIEIDNIKQKEELEHKEKVQALKSFNKWKMVNTRKNGQCAECFGDNLTIETNTSKESDPISMKWLYGKTRAHPTEAMYNCKDCGHVISKWQYKEGRNSGV